MPDTELAPFTTVFRASDQHRVKRNRQAVSCTACQKRKSKCDRKQPCGACEKRGEATVCRMGPPNTAAGKQEVQARLSKLEEMVRGLAEGSQTRPEDEGVVPDRGDVLGNGRVLGEVHGYYHGATSWAALVESIHDIQQVLYADFDDEASEQPVAKEPDVVLGDVGKITIDDVVNALPERQDADRIIQAFFHAKFLVVPYIHVHQFRRQYEAFWETPSSAGFLWISILFSILNVGTMIAMLKGVTPSSPETTWDPRHFLVKSAQCLAAGEYHKAGPLSVEALLIHAHSRMVQKQDSDASVWCLYGLCIRLAQRRGYHRDPVKVSPNISPYEAEMRRRAWFSVQSMDLLFSFQHGMPPMIHDEVCDIGLPNNLADEDFDEDTPLPSPRPPTDPTPILVYITKSKLCYILRRIIQHALAVKPIPYSQTLALHKELEDYYESVPACLRIRTIRSTAFTDPNYTIMHRLVLELMYRKSLCVLHRPYLTVDKDDVKYEMSRNICREAALRSIDLHIEFDREIKPWGRMYEDRYMVSSLTQHDFLIAAMVICVDLSESTNISQEDRANRVKFLQTAHGIWSTRSSHSLDALHASRVLRAILNKVDSPGVSSEGSTLVPDKPSSGTSHSGEQYLGFPNYVAQPSSRHEYLMDLDNTQQLESFFGAPESLDWKSIDSYLRSNPFDEASWDPPYLGLTPT